MKNQLLTLILMLTMVVTGYSGKPTSINTDADKVKYELKTNSMSKVTQKQIDDWKEKYTDVYMLTSEEKVGYIYDPTADMNTMKMIISVFQSGNPSETTEAVLNNCWLGGDEDLKTNDLYRNHLDDQVNKLIDIPEFEITEHEDYATVTVLGKSCDLKYASRGDIKFAEDKNKLNKPFKTSEYLLERIEKDQSQVDAMRADNKTYLGLLLAVQEVKAKKYVGIKKL